MVDRVRRVGHGRFSSGVESRSRLNAGEAKETEAIPTQSCETADTVTRCSAATLGVAR